MKILMSFRSRRESWRVEGIIVPVWQVWKWVKFAIQHITDPIETIRIEKGGD